MRRFFAIFLLALLPFQFSWSAVAPYCGHEREVTSGHFGHHEHRHHSAAASDDDGRTVVDSQGTAEPHGDKTPGANHLDCGQCHGGCGVMLSLPAGLPDAASVELPSVTVNVASGAHAPTRPERPQWLPLA